MMRRIILVIAAILFASAFSFSQSFKSESLPRARPILSICSTLPASYAQSYRPIHPNRDGVFSMSIWNYSATDTLFFQLVRTLADTAYTRPGYKSGGRVLPGMGLSMQVRVYSASPTDTMVAGIVFKRSGNDATSLFSAIFP